MKRLALVAGLLLVRAAVAGLPGVRYRFSEISLNRRGRADVLEADSGGSGGPRLWNRRFRWNSGDTATKAWIPAGITDLPDGRLLVSWRHRPDGPKGYRLSVVDRTDPGDIRYRHVLLVRPIDGPRRFAPLRTPATNRAGGLARVGDRLYLGSYERGLEVFDLDDLFGAVPDPTKSRCGRIDGLPHALNYGYYLVQERHVPPEDLDGRWASWLARDEQGRLVSASGSNYPPIAAKPVPARDLAPAAMTTYDPGPPLARAGGRTLPRWGAFGYQKWGVASRGPRAWVVARRSEGWRLLERGEGGEGPPLRAWPAASRDLYLTPDGAELWSVTSPPGDRMVFSVRVGSHATAR